MRVQPLTKADIPDLPEATLAQQRPNLWKIDDLDGLFEYVGPKTPYENLSSEYREAYDRTGGVSILAHGVLARRKNRVFQFIRVD